MRIREEDNDEAEEVEIRVPVPKRIHDRLQADKQLNDTTIRAIVRGVLADRYEIDLEEME